jgi:hypothetical protein
MCFSISVRHDFRKRIAFERFPGFTRLSGKSVWRFGGMILTEKTKVLVKNPAPLPLFHRFKSIDLGSNPGLRGARSATNRLSHGTAITNLK